MGTGVGKSTFVPIFFCNEGGINLYWILQYPISNISTSMPSNLAQQFIDRLQLAPHPEGGYYRRTYQSSINIPNGSLPEVFTGNRLAATAIYFLLTGDSFSAFHRLKVDEMWHFYAGEAVVLHCIYPNGELQTYYLGNPLNNPEASFQVLIPAQTWFSAEVITPAKDDFALVGCTLSPGFDFADFELAEKAVLLKAYPQYGELIQRLVRA